MTFKVVTVFVVVMVTTNYGCDNDDDGNDVGGDNDKCDMDGSNDGDNNDDNKNCHRQIWKMCDFSN